MTQTPITDLVRRMIDAGATVDPTVLAAIQSHELNKDETAAARRAATRARVARFRARKATGNADVTPRNTHVTLPSEIPKQNQRSGNAHVTPHVTLCNADFDAFWASFPNKVGKQDARRAFDKARRQVDQATLMAGLEAYRSKNDDRPWCNPATWLNGGRWDDQPAAAPAKPNGEHRNGVLELRRRLRESVPEPEFDLAARSRSDFD